MEKSGEYDKSMLGSKSIDVVCTILGFWRPWHVDLGLGNMDTSDPRRQRGQSSSLDVKLKIKQVSMRNKQT